MTAPHDTLTTGAAARLLGLSVQTVIRCCAEGLLPFRRMPGSTHRRIERADLEAFAARHGVPLQRGEGPERGK